MKSSLFKIGEFDMNKNELDKEFNNINKIGKYFKLYLCFVFLHLVISMLLILMRESLTEQYPIISGYYTLFIFVYFFLGYNLFITKKLTNKVDREEKIRTYRMNKYFNRINQKY